MTAPRQILRNTTHLVTRRCSERRLFLRPSKTVNQIFLYVLAVAAQEFDVLVHAYCVLSDHFHLVITDTKGNLPAFMQYLDGLVARAMNSVVGHWESFWAPGSYSAVSLPEAGDVLNKIAYTLANPVRAGLVRRGAQWPGLWSAPEQIGGAAIRVKRPEAFFREVGLMPETATLKLAPPPGFESLEDFRSALVAELSAREEEAARDLAAEGRSFLGVRKVLAQDPHGRPRTREPRRGLNPRIAGQDQGARKEALERLKAFLLAYRIAWREFAEGARDAVFPLGTYWMRVAYGLPCASAG
jgi:putative transposase